MDTEERKDQLELKDRPADEGSVENKDPPVHLEKTELMAKWDPWDVKANPDKTDEMARLDLREDPVVTVSTENLDPSDQQDKQARWEQKVAPERTV